MYFLYFKITVQNSYKKPYTYTKLPNFKALNVFRFIHFKLETNLQ